MFVGGHMQEIKMVTEVNQDQNPEVTNGGRISSASFAKRLVTPRDSIQREARRARRKKSKREKWH